jgi:hypothetical protein
MTSDLPDDLGPADPGLEQLLTALASGPTPGELAGEQSALAMFRANFQPPPPAPARGTRPMRQLRPAPRSRTHGLRFRLVAATTTALVGGFAAAAYAAVLPAPVQHVAYQAFHVIGVPDVRPHPAATSHKIPPHSASRGASGHPGSSPSSRSHPTPSASGHTSSPASPSPSPSPSQHGSPSPSTTVPAGPLALSLQASSSQILAGTAVTLTGQLTGGSASDTGVTIRVMEHAAGELGWHLAGLTTTSADGDVTFTVASLVTNARFRLADAALARSPVAIVTVVPTVTTNLRLGPEGVKDYLTVTTLYAHRGDEVALQVYRSGTWVTIRSGLLTGKGRYVFVLNAQKMQGKMLQVALLPTRRHAAAVSASVTVPPPA